MASCSFSIALLKASMSSGFTSSRFAVSASARVGSVVAARRDFFGTFLDRTRGGGALGMVDLRKRRLGRGRVDGLKIGG